MVRNNDKRTDARVPADPDMTHKPQDWICPKCGKGVSPFAEVCPCSKLVENIFVQNG